MRYIKFDINEFKLFRSAKSKDIVVGKIVYLIGDDEELFEKKIQEVLRPDDPWKAFTADDGCRYGLRDLYIVKKIK